MHTILKYKAIAGILAKLLQMIIQLREDILFVCGAPLTTHVLAPIEA
jgi:hypothetical protein